MKALILTMTMSVLAAGCWSGGGGTVTTMSIAQYVGDDYFSLHHDTGPYPAIEVGKPNSCIEVLSDVDNRVNYCRVIDGLSTGAAGGFIDRRQWKISWSPEQGGRPAGVAKSDYYGYSIVLDDGGMFEGCGYNFDHNYYRCDYRIRKPVVPSTFCGGWCWSYVLHKAWDWSGYAANAAECAGGITGVSIGKHITFPMLRGCADGPM
jgi:hypothetical protein